MKKYYKESRKKGTRWVQ